MSIESVLKKEITAYRETPVAVAVSGGPDSLVLADLFHRFHRGSVVLIHIHHGIRSMEESMEEDSLVDLFARERGLTLYRRYLGNNTLRNLSREEGCGLEDAARRARYAYFEEIRRLRGGVVALGHHRDDQSETVADRFLRGAGIAGLAGIPRTRESFIRPLLDISRKEIEAYASSRGLVFHCDRSNEDPAYQRNKMRHFVLPFLRAYFPSIDRTLNGWAERASDIQRYIETQAEKIPQKKLPDGKIVLKTSDFFNADIVLRRQIIYNTFNRLKKGMWNSYRLPQGFVEEAVRFRKLTDEVKSIRGHGLFIEMDRTSIRFNPLEYADFPGVVRILSNAAPLSGREKWLHDRVEFYYISKDSLSFPVVERSLYPGDCWESARGCHPVVSLLKKRGISRGAARWVGDRRGGLAIIAENRFIMKSMRLKSDGEDEDPVLGLSHRGVLEFYAEQQQQ